jgi:DNA-binding HxlR family transcriptional regulator
MDVLERVRLLPEGDYQAYGQPYNQTYNEAGVGRTVVDPLLCPVEVAARIVGQKWTLQIVKTLLDSQSRRFCELQDALGGVNPSTLSSRLKMLEDEGLIRRVQVSAIPPHVEYSLTEMGSQLQCVIREIAKWSQNWLCTPERVHEWQAHEEE